MPIHDGLVNALSSVAVNLLSDLGKAAELLEHVGDVAVFELKRVATTPPDVAAGDSSWALKSYSMTLVYACQAVAVKSSFGRPSSTTYSVKVDAGYYVPSPYVSDFIADEVVRRAVQFISRELEVRSLLEVSEGAEIALFDGSLFSFLWYSKFPEIPHNLKSHRGRPSKFREIWRSVVSNIEAVSKAGAVPVFVAKSIRRSYYVDKLLSAELLEQVGSKVNDLILISLMKAGGRLPRGAFVLEPMYISSIEELPRPLNSLDLEDRELLKPLVPVTVTYAVFNPAAQPYQVTVPGKWGAEDIVELMSALYPCSYSGYPDPLKVAHGLSKIGNREFRYVLLKLGISSIPTGRELLGEFA